jgi:heme-degrading monooxygenase HmoA
MYARVITAQVQPGKIEEAVSIYRNAVVPAVRRQKGFKGISLLIDRNMGEHLRIVIWETEADTAADEATVLLREQIGKMASTFAGPPITEHCEVSAHV